MEHMAAQMDSQIEGAQIAYERAFSKGQDPAFPVFPDTAAGHAAAHKGLTMRDYFAAKVIPEFLELCEAYATAAKEAYAVADAMLAAREA